MVDIVTNQSIEMQRITDEGTIFLFFVQCYRDVTLVNDISLDVGHALLWVLLWLWGDGFWDNFSISVAHG